MFKRLEKAYGKLVAELERLTAKAKGTVPARKRVVCKSRRTKKPKIVRKAFPPKRQRGLTSGTLKALAKKSPAQVSDIVGYLPGFGYKVKDERKTKLAVFQTLNRLLKVHKVERSARGVYQLAS
jgi:hypothetical protein